MRRGHPKALMCRARPECAGGFRDVFQPVLRVPLWANEVLDMVLDMLNSNSIELPASTDEVQETV